jgi:hypothetical protein
MARTTLDIDVIVLSELRERAKAEGKSMGQVATELLTPLLKDGGQAAAPFAFEWDSWEMGTPVVDLEDKDAVQRLLDDDAPLWRAP